MSGTDKTLPNNQEKRWIITVGIFLIVQLLFVIVDGTGLEPNINDSGNLFARGGRWMMDSKLFTVWFTPYSFPFFNMVMVVHIVAIFIQAVQSIIASMYPKK